MLLDEMVFDLYQLASEDRERIRNFVTSDLPRFATIRYPSASPPTDEWMQSYCDVLAGALQATLGVEVRGIFFRQESYYTVAVVIADESTFRASLSFLRLILL